MKRNILPTITELRRRFDYNPITGKLINRRTGKECCGLYEPFLYYTIRVGGILYLVHRVCWKMHYWTEPPEEIDHENNNKLDNRITNMRDATHADNIYNRLKQKNNTSGFKGVCWHGQKQRWRAYIVKDYQQKHLGLFETREAAHAAYCAAASEIAKEFANGG